jgi:hypothetical protein
MTKQPGYDGLNINSDLLKEQRGGSIRDAQRRAFNADRRRLGIPEMGSELSETPELSPTMTYGTGVSGDKSLSVSVSGNVQGQGEMTIKVEAGSTLIQVVEQPAPRSSSPGQSIRTARDRLGIRRRTLSRHRRRRAARAAGGEISANREKADRRAAPRPGAEKSPGIIIR